MISKAGVKIPSIVLNDITAIESSSLTRLCR